MPFRHRMFEQPDGTVDDVPPENRGPMTTKTEPKPGDHVTCPQFAGVVLWFVEMETERVEPEWISDCDEDHDCTEACGHWTADPDDPLTWDDRETGQAVVIMVGDDMRWYVDPADLTVHDDDVCSCGQVGCGWA